MHNAIPEDVFLTVKQMPSWGFRPGVGRDSSVGWVNWRMPAFYKTYCEYLQYAPRLHDRIEARFKRLVDTILPVDWVEFRFNAKGIVINVPGDACGIYPESGIAGDYGGHNIDTMAQTISLYVCLCTALEEIYSVMTIWVREGTPITGIKKEFYSQIYRTAKSIDARPFSLWEARDHHYSEVAYIYARTHEEAVKIADSQDPSWQVTMLDDDQPQLLSAMKVFKFSVVLENGFKIPYKVLAFHCEDASFMLEKELQKRPPLAAEVKEISLLDNEGELPQPMIIGPAS